ncbi:hydantoinase/oxoprolinase family protein [Rhodopirellula sp. JC639]|uniref:hydantoinase/oxoprolinase family protein n=1 Tax=Stieleria mannarensis TaxID=2755585 RepID=UPI001601CE32|nr:hydantoinase/oxoprolinase family protein [Rhodopirellula sp. JC639]
MLIPSPESQHATLGVDIGGANLKYADTTGRASSVEFPLWMRPDDLAGQLQSDLASYPDVTQLVVTMTGELADCFLDRAAGVQHIVDQVCRAAKRCGWAAPSFYAVDGQFHSADGAMQNVDLVAAANWHALANWVARRFAPQLTSGGLLVDIGSTTTDLIPLRAGSIATSSRTDFDRLAEGSLVYVGGGRTPVCSLVDHLDFNGRAVPVMREVFATMDDVRLLLGFQPGDGSDCRSADGKPRDSFHAANRIARMIGLDHRTVATETATDLAAQVHQRARDLVRAAIDSLGSEGPLIVSGHCSDLMPDNADGREVISLPETLGDQVSRSAPAYAMAQLFAQK